MFFSDVGGTEERGTPYYIHTRIRQASAGVYIREMKRKYGEYRGRTKETQTGNPKKRKKDGRKGRKEDGVKGNIRFME
jgi:hypothetical protein